MRRIHLHWQGVAAGLALLLTTTGLTARETNQVSAPAVRRLHRISPVEFFRALLGMTASEREKALAGKSPTDREIILAKIGEYETLPKPIREARLCQTELHWELAGLIRLSPSNRLAQLNDVSVLYRPMLEGLLREWDALPPESQKTLLEKQSFIAVYLRMQGSSAAAQRQIIDKLPPMHRAQWAGEMNRWQALPEAQRAELCAQFQHFCSMSGEAQRETVSALGEAERREMESTLQTFDRLPAAQRSLCIGSFRKFATMSAAEQSQFLKNAARWDAMTSHERELWRNLVQTLPPMPPMPADFPPLPPGLSVDVPPAPPMPPNVTAPVVVSSTKNDLR